MTNWRSLDPAALEAHMNPRVAVGSDRVDAYLADYAERSAAARQRMDGTFDIRFHDGPKATFDLFRPAGAGPHPALVFIHGGYWRALDKAEHHFVAEPPVRAGFAVLVVNYDLCPAVTLDAIVAQMRALMRFLAAEAAGLGLRGDGIALAGHSAGAHLAALLLHEPGTDRAPPFTWAQLSSGIFEPEAARRISVNDEIGLTADVASRNDALVRLPARRLRLEVVVGGREPPAWIGQSEAMARALANAGQDVDYRVVPEADHFSLLHHPIVPPRGADL